MAPTFSRRQFIQAGTAAAVAATVSVATLGCPPNPPPPATFAVVFKRSGYHRRVSNAAKLHNANKLYRTLQAAMDDPPHPGDNSKVVKRSISNELFQQLFPTSGILVVDLRHDL